MADGLATKEALGRALKELTVQKGFDKVSVGDITGVCGLGRQSFYYHFQDKFQLLEWVFAQELLLPFEKGINLQNWPGRISQMLETMEQNRKFYVNAIKAQPDFFAKCMGEVLERLFYRLESAASIAYEQNEQQRKFSAQFYALGCSAVITRWARNGMRETAAALADNLYQLAQNSEKATHRLAHEQLGEGRL